MDHFDVLFHKDPIFIYLRKLFNIDLQKIYKLSTENFCNV